MIFKRISRLFIASIFIGSLPSVAMKELTPSVLLNNLINRQRGATIEKTTFDETAFNEKWKNIFSNEVLNAVEMGERFKKAIKENWKVQELLNKEPFHLGLSSSAYQFEGGIYAEDAMHDFYTKNKKPMPGDAIDFWNNYEQIIDEMATCGINTFRLSFSWARIQPEKEKFNQDALNHYRDIVKYLLKKGIKPLGVFHHYTDPTWFQKEDGFEKLENARYFAEFGKKVYENLADLVTHWSSFNAIEGYAFKGYYTMDNPPAKPGNIVQKLTRVGRVMANMLEAHVQLYEAIKGLPTRETTTGAYQKLLKDNPTLPEPQIGIQKNILPIDPATNNIASYYIGKIRSFIGNRLQNEGFFNFFATGTFTVFGKNYPQHTNIHAPFTLDWIGINTYSNRYEGLGKIEEPEALKTENENYRFYPEGIDRAVRMVYDRIVEPLNKNHHTVIPIWITENGIATKNDVEGNKKRELFFKRALLVITKLIEEGYPIVAYTPWASHDNYEWGSDKGTKRYGMFYVDFDNIYTAHPLKEGAKYFCNFVDTVLHK